MNVVEKQSFDLEIGKVALKIAHLILGTHC